MPNYNGQIYKAVIDARQLKGGVSASSGYPILWRMVGDARLFMARLRVGRMTEMRVCIIAGLALLVVGTAQGSVVDAAADAQRNCELMVKGSFHDNAEARSAGECGGMIESAMFFSSSLPPDVRACPPELGSTLESAKVLLRYLDKNPDRLEQPGITVVFEAFRDAWPCQGDDAETSGRPASKKRISKKAKMPSRGGPIPAERHQGEKP